MEGPNYGNMGDHTETVQVDYDPGRITYARLLEIFWGSHRPTSRNGSRQYMNAIFYHNEEQRRLAMDSKTAVELKNGGTIRSEVLPPSIFYHGRELSSEIYAETTDETQERIVAYLSETSGFCCIHCRGAFEWICRREWHPRSIVTGTGNTGAEYRRETGVVGDGGAVKIGFEGDTRVQGGFISCVR